MRHARKHNPTISYRGSVDNVVRELTFEAVREAPGGFVEALRPSGRWERFGRSRVLAIDGVPLRRGGKPSELFARTVPMPERPSWEDHTLASFYGALAASRTLRTAVDRVRAIEADPSQKWREGVIFETDDAFDVAVPDDAVGAWPERLHGAGEFVGGAVWDAKGRREARRAVFDALLAWKVLRDPHGKRGDRTARFDWSRLPAHRDVYVELVRRVYEDSGRSARRTVFNPTWRRYGLDDLEVRRMFVEGQTYGQWWYDQAGSLVDLRFPKEPPPGSRPR